jgi:hypothetical protein
MSSTRVRPGRTKGEDEDKVLIACPSEAKGEDEDKVLIACPSEAKGEDEDKVLIACRVPQSETKVKR